MRWELRGETGCDKTGEELDKSCCFSLSEIVGMIADLESALGAGGKHAKFCLRGESAPFEDAAVKLAVSRTVDIAKFRAVLDERLSSSVAAVSSRLHRPNAELREAHGCVAALHKKTAALWDIVCPESPGT